MKRVLQALTGAGSALIAVAAVVCVLAVSVIAVKVLEARVMNERREKIRATVEIALGVLDHHLRLEQTGERSREDAQRAAMEAIRALRFGDGNYFFIQDGGGRLLMHPFRPDLEGRVNDERLPTGKTLPEEFVEKARGPGHAGYVAYRWPRPGGKVPVRKLAYVRLYAPWGWVVGTGVYLDDLDATMAADGRRVYLAAAFVTLLLGVAGLGLTLNVKRARRLELELEQARKLEAVGQLAAGIAHEINTPIQFIGDNSLFLEEALADVTGLVKRYRQAAHPEMRESLSRLEDEIDLPYLLDQMPKALGTTRDGVQRVAAIVRAMKEFAHPDERQMVAADLNRALQATLEVARTEYRYVADVETELGEIPLVTCHPGELNQVFLNVTVNAAHAVADAVKDTRQRGTIRVSTQLEGSDVVVAISDTGGGIPARIREKVFEPFFTTREVGRGTGQGLAIARSIVRRHEGSISFETRPGEGTTFFIRLPVSGPAGARDQGTRPPKRVGA